MRREHTLDSNKYLYEKTTVDVTLVVENFKKEFAPKIMLSIEPLLNAILTNNKLKSEDQEILVNSIHDNINIYYYMNIEILIKLINLTATSKFKEKLKKIKDNPIDLLDMKEEYEHLKKDQKQIYEMRFNHLVDRYIQFLIQVL